MNPREAHPFLVTRAAIIEDQRRHEYELMRIQTYKLFPNFSKTYQPTMDAFLPFTWDKARVFNLDMEQFSEDAFRMAEQRYLGKPFIPENKE